MTAESAAGVRVEEFAFEADGLALQGSLHLPAAPARPPVVIGCHGLWSDRRSPKQVALAEALAAAGVACLRIDHRGCGGSAGTRAATVALEARVADLCAAAAALGRRGGLGRPLGLFGSSMGGAVCLRAAPRLGAAAVVSYAAPVRIRIAAAARRGMEPPPPEDFDLAPGLGAVSNLLVIHGEADEVVPVAHAREIYAAAAPPKRLIVQPGGDHLASDPRHQAELIREAAAWLAAALAAAGR
jgi:alpha-beta hydrolase superfamily lysophospholipase